MYAFNFDKEKIMSITLDNTQTPTMPPCFYQLIEQELANIDLKGSDAITLNFRDPDYCAKNGGYHPVEVRIEKQQGHWRFEYVTDFSFYGHPYPELVKDIDICFNRQQVYSVFSGWIGKQEGIELIELFAENFVTYHQMGAYQVHHSLG